MAVIPESVLQPRIHNVIVSISARCLTRNLTLIEVFLLMARQPDDYIANGFQTYSIVIAVGLISPTPHQTGLSLKRKHL